MDIKKIHIKRLINAGAITGFLIACSVGAFNGRIIKEYDPVDASYAGGAVKAISGMIAKERTRMILKEYTPSSTETVVVAEEAPAMPAPAVVEEVPAPQEPAPAPMPVEAVEPQPLVQEPVQEAVQEVKRYPTTNTDYLNDEELLVLAKCVFAEDGSEPVESQEMIVDSILNMVDDPRYPDSVQGVVFNPGSFEVIPLGMYDKAVPNERTWQAIYNELPQFGGDRNSYEVKFFRTKHYHTFGTPMLNIGNVYFSKD